MIRGSMSHSPTVKDVQIPSSWHSTGMMKSSEDACCGAQVLLPQRRASSPLGLNDQSRVGSRARAAYIVLLRPWNHNHDVDLLIMLYVNLDVCDQLTQRLVLKNRLSTFRSTSNVTTIASKPRL
ncbi:hypothetical protein L210DRAFT_3755752 [Boletus edulis BED1]|uniref:Uncharacterized protein n=1 Tax=Boletus edulis BED1 TaxID=1328754 RepID=A0AAD4GMI1_BOLED|nr:hypothetical protein L210DRAFT_3755752 [Boletus edulis BED1]